MKFSIVLLTSLAIALAAPTNDGKKGTVAIPITVRKKANAGSKSKRSVVEPLKNQVLEYVAQFEIGSPGQTIEALIDTGSSDLWVYTAKSGESGDTYDSSSSSTYKYLNSDFSIQYVSGSASGDWVTDTVTVGGASVTNQQFGAVNTKTDSDVGILGIGLEDNESASTEYVNFPANLVKQGIISSNLYSLYLDDLDASSGTILFGGTDTSKYTGSLVTLPLTNKNEFSVSASVDGIGSGFDAVLDSGTSLTYLPSSVVSEIATKLGAKYDSSNGIYTLSSVPSESLTYNLGSAQIKVPGSELALPNSDLGLSGSGYVLSILPNSQSDGINLLGDSFLRSAYVVYDLDNLQIQIAQASYDTTSSNIVVH